MGKVLITGAAGFLGSRLAQALLDRGEVGGERIEELVLTDRGSLPDNLDGVTDVPVSTVCGDVTDPAVLDALIDAQTSVIFHLAAVVSGQAEADFDLGMHVNLDVTRAILERVRVAGAAPRLIFTSSAAAFGGELPAVVTDSTAVHPQSSYGIQKAIGELLVAEYTRRGFVDGRIVRLPTISVRPGQPNAAASSFLSGIIREPLAGLPAALPVDPATPVWLMSPAKVIDGLVGAADLPAGALGEWPVLNLPGLAVTVAQMLEALRAIAGDEVAKLVYDAPDERVRAVVSTWPAAWDNSRAEALGLAGDASIDALIQGYLSEVHGT